MATAGANRSRKKDWKIQNVDIEVKRGDTLDIDYEVNYIDSAKIEQPYDFTGAEIKAHIKRNKKDNQCFGRWQQIMGVHVLIKCHLR